MEVSAGAQRQEGGRGAELHGDAQILDRPRRKRHRTPGAEQRAAVPVRPAGSGLVARRPLYRPLGRGAGVRRHQDQGAGLQHDTQAREGRARALVLPLRQARHDRMAGHAQRRPRSRSGRCTTISTGEEKHRSAESEANFRKEWKEIIDYLYSVPLDRRMGSLQRVRGDSSRLPGNRGVDEGLRSFASGQPRQRRQPLPHGRHPRHAPLPQPAPDAARYQPRNGAG